MKIRPSVAIVKDGKLMLMKYVYGGVEVYNLPGGNAEEMEAIAETVERELMEELKLSVKTNQLLLVGETHQISKNNSVLHLVFDATIITGNPILNPEHTTALEVVWISVDEIHLLNMYPNVGRLLFKNQTPYVGQIPQQWF
jgi:8-oxo-dGTP diphosphatase